MNAYLAKIIYQILCGNGQHTAQFDEQVRWITAADEEAALIKAQHIGLQEEEVFFNDKQQLVQWKFIEVAELHDLSQLSDGAEVFSQVKETSDGEAYTRFVHQKAAALRKKHHSQPLQTA